nr:MAG TPA: hypothetical protein [Caudoviricetes sp.]
MSHCLNTPTSRLLIFLLAGPMSIHSRLPYLV